MSWPEAFVWAVAVICFCIIVRDIIKRM